MKSRTIQLAVRKGYKPLLFTINGFPKKTTLNLTQRDRAYLEIEMLRMYLESKMHIYIEVTYVDGYYDLTLRLMKEKGTIFKQFSGYRSHATAVEEGCKMLCV